MEAMFETIVWATDGSELADHALAQVRELAEVHGSRIVTVHANQVLAGRAGGAPGLADEPDIRQRIKEQVKELRDAGFDASLEIRSGHEHVARLVRRAADDVDADLIVVGTHGHGGIAAAVMGSVARALCHTSSCPVLVVPPPERSGRAREESEQLATA
jgi:nucleotide-binding universal stress UspA family protein